MMAHLGRVLDAEGVVVEEDALRLLARASEGSVSSRTGVGGTAPARVGEQREELVARAQAASRTLIA